MKSGANGASKFGVWDANSSIAKDFYHIMDFNGILKHFCNFFFLAITGPAPSQKHGVTKESLAHHPNWILNAFEC